MFKLSPAGACSGEPINSGHPGRGKTRAFRTAIVGGVKAAVMAVRLPPIGLM